MITETSERAITPAARVDVLIVGAGICGLSAAQGLAEQGRSVAVLDKGRSVGGRMATRRLGPGRADHGAQFFTVRDRRLAALVEGWRQQNLVFRWSNGWSDGSLPAPQPTTESTTESEIEPAKATTTSAAAVAGGHPRYAVQGGMNNLPKHLAGELSRQGVTITTNCKVMAAWPGADGWNVQDDAGHVWRSRSLVLTAPAPQSLAILAGGGAAPPRPQQEALAAITYAPCLAALCRAEGVVWLPAPGAVQRPSADIAWIADNQRKGISPYAAVFTLHGGPAWSAAHFTDPDEALRDTFCAALDEWASGGRVHMHEMQIKRWRYALPIVLHPQPYLRAEGLPPLYFGGDGFGAPRVEGAVQSGLEIAAALAHELAHARRY